MEKRYGATERDDQLMQIGRQKWELIYGYETDGTMGWNYRQRYSGRKPTLEEIKQTVLEQANKNVDEKILSGLKYDGQTVWLSTENQLNYKTAYDMAVQTDGKTLPVTFKLGTEEEPCYKTFSTLDELGAFYTAVVKHIQDTLAAGWKEKDNIDWDKFKT